MMTDSVDPWEDITPPTQTTSASARRVDPSMRWDMFWALDADRKCLLMLRHARGANLPTRLPKLQGLQVESRSPDTDSHDLLVIRLMDGDQRELFHRLCLDIVTATGLAQTEEEAIERFLTRTWRWHRLLKGGRDGRLDDEEQKGLLGELRVLQEHLFPAIGVSKSVRCWSGPLGTPKDFEIGRVCIEAKARRGAAVPYVAISSEHQLDSTSVDTLFLYVLEVATAAGNTRTTVTISEAVDAVRRVIVDHALAVADLFEERLAAIGFDRLDDYSDRHWIMGAEHLFEVREGFPRITPSMFTSGVSHVRYSIALTECEPFRTGSEILAKLISESSGDDQS